MNIIKEKKIHSAIMILLVSLAMGYSAFYAMRGTLASFGGTGFQTELFNDAVAFVLSAMSAGIVYELITLLLFRSGAHSLGQSRVNDMRYALRFFMIPAGILSGAVKTVYYFVPLAFPFGETLIEFIFKAVFFAFFIVFSCKAYCRKDEYAAVTMKLGSSFLALYGFLAGLSLIVEVAL